MVIRPLDDHSFGALVRAIGVFIASLHNQPMYPKMCATDIFVNPNRLAEICKGLFDPLVWELGGQEFGVGPFDSSRMGSY